MNDGFPTAVVVVGLATIGMVGAHWGIPGAPILIGVAVAILFFF